MNQTISKHSLQDLISFYLSCDTISLSDVMSCTEDLLMNKILKQVHPYQIFFSESDNRWHTYIKDETKLSGRKPIARKEKKDLEKYLLGIYSIQIQLKQNRTFKEIFSIVQEAKLKYIKTEEKKISAQNTAEKTNREYKRYFANTTIESMFIHQITKNDLEELCFYNLQRYDMKKKAFASMRSIIKSVFDYAYSEYWIQDNIYQRVDFKKFKDMMIPEINISKRVHSKDEFTRFLHELHEKQKNRPKCSSYWALELQMIMGLRRGEIPPLRWKEDISDSYVSITREQLTCEKGYVIVEHTKNHKDRYFPITNDLKEFLIRLKDMHDKYYPDSKYLFPADNTNGIITNRSVYCVYEKICKKIGIEKEDGIILGPHSFRRNAITDVINSTNGNIILASALFGNSPEVAKKNYYTGIDLDMAKEVLDKRKLI